MFFDGHIDLNEFIEVPSPEERSEACRLSLSRDDQLTQNTAFHKKLDGAREFCLRISPDGHMLALSVDGRPNISFSPAGVRVHHQLAEMLRQRGLELPLSYIMQWNNDLGCWIGRYDGLRPPCEAKHAGNSARRKKAA